jgi:dehydrogenase/reductase SDR family protein 12
VTGWATTVDGVLEASVVGSYTRLGIEVRRRLPTWPADGEVAGRTIVLTAATSGIGRAAAVALASDGARLRFLARDAGRGRAAREAIVEASGNHDVEVVIADVADPASLRAAAADLEDRDGQVDVLVHLAGGLAREHVRGVGGVEVTTATHLIGPFVLTGALLPALRASGDARVLTVASAGMLTARGDLDRLDPPAAGYRGAATYAEVKRAAAILADAWTARFGDDGVAFPVLHPGWVDTPGLASGLPAFHRLLRPALRTPAQGADTLCWLAGRPAPTDPEGWAGFWHDRAPRPLHRRRATEGGARPDEVWDWCEAMAARAG